MARHRCAAECAADVGGYRQYKWELRNFPKRKTIPPGSKYKVVMLSPEWGCANLDKQSAVEDLCPANQRLSNNETMKPILAQLILLASAAASGFGQGGLIPTSPPAPTLKTLEQIEPRRPISTAPFTITQSGSYYVTTNLVVDLGDCIRINANNVTLNLNGFTLSSTQPQDPPVAAAAIYVGQSRAVTNIAIVNGIISGGVTNNNGVFGGKGFDYGIYAWSPGGYNIRVKDVIISACRSSGIYLGVGSSSSTVESCSVNTVAATGIFAASVFNSTALNCGNIAIEAILANSCYTANGTNRITYKYNMP